MKIGDDENSGKSNIQLHIFFKNILIIVVPSVVAFFSQKYFWDITSDHAWLFFYPAVFISAWLGGATGGIGAMILSSWLAWWYFVPPVKTIFKDDPKYLIYAGVYILMETGISLIYELLIKSKRLTQMALLETKSLNEELKSALNDRQIFYVFFENSNDFILISDPNGKPLYLNPAGKRMISLPPDYPIEATTIKDYFTLEQQKNLVPTIDQLIVEVGNWEGESKFRDWKSGEVINVSIQHFVIKDNEKKNILGIGTVSRNISGKLKESQSTISHLQESIGLALRGAKLGPWDWDIKSGKVVFSPEWASLRGYEANEIIQDIEGWKEGIHPDDLERVICALNNYLDGTTPEYECEFRVRNSDGDWVWVLDLGKVFEWNESGEPIRMVGVEHKIGEQKQSEKELIAKQNMYAVIISLSVDGIIFYDKNMHIILFNKGAENMFSYMEEEVLGTPVEILIPPRFREANVQIIENFKNSDEESRAVQDGGYGLKKNGKEFPMQMSISKYEYMGKLIFMTVIRNLNEWSCAYSKPDSTERPDDQSNKQLV